MLLLRLRLRGGGKPKTRSSTLRKRVRDARWARAAEQLDRGYLAIDIGADGLPRNGIPLWHMHNMPPRGIAHRPTSTVEVPRA